MNAREQAAPDRVAITCRAVHKQERKFLEGAAHANITPTSLRSEVGAKYV